jgi:simple sugar transport system ATP-binding protein
MVLRYVAQARNRGLGVVFISHNIHHAYTVADRFTLLNRGRSRGTFLRSDITRDEVLHVMAGGEDLQRVEMEINRLGTRRAVNG